MDLSAIEARTPSAKTAFDVQSVRNLADYIERIETRELPQWKHPARDIRELCDDLTTARTDISALIAEVRRLQTLLGDVFLAFGHDDDEAYSADVAEEARSLHRYAMELELKGASATQRADAEKKRAGELREALECTLPMARGYAAQHAVESNARKIEIAEAALSPTPGDETSMRNDLRRDDARESAQAAPSDLLALAERCEKAPGPSKALSVAIWAATHEGGTPIRWVSDNEVQFLVRKCCCWDEPRHIAGLGHWRTSANPAFMPPDHSRSIDAALTLVPEGWRWLVRAPDEGNWRFFANCMSADARQHTVTSGDRTIDESTGTWKPAGGATPALALCAAALKARAHIAASSPPAPEDK